MCHIVSNESKIKVAGRTVAAPSHGKSKEPGVVAHSNRGASIFNPDFIDILAAWDYLLARLAIAFLLTIDFTNPSTG